MGIQAQVAKSASKALWNGSPAFPTSSAAHAKPKNPADPASGASESGVGRARAKTKKEKETTTNMSTKEGLQEAVGTHHRHTHIHTQETPSRVEATRSRGALVP